MNFQKMMILVLAAAVWTGCTQENPVVTEEQVTEEQHTTVQFTATLEGKGGEATKALSSDGTATWAVDEEIALYYQTTSSYATATATVTSVDASGNATIEATLSDAKNGGTVKFVYPATLHDGTGGIDESALLAQHGTIADISTSFDAATATDVLRAAGSSYITASGSVTLTNQLLIGKFIPKYNSSEIDGITSRTVNAGTRTYTVTPSSGTCGTDGIYVAMLPVTQQEVILIAETDSQNYGFGGKLITLEQGKFYTNLAIPMLKAYDLTDGDVDIDDNVFIYQSDATATANKVALDGCTAILSNLNIEAEFKPGIACSDDVTLTLSGSNTVLISMGDPAIRAGDEYHTLTIQGSGSLTATGGGSAAGIGSGESGTCGAITISGGEVTATGGKEAAGIGSGGGGTCGNITISGGTVTATGGNSAAGIGSGVSGTCGTITISGGKVTATGGFWGAGIGSGYRGYFSSITIESTITSVTATMDEEAQAPIGKGREDAGSGTVTIDNTTSWTAGTATANLNFTVSTTYSGYITWTLTPSS